MNQCTIVHDCSWHLFSKITHTHTHNVTNFKNYAWRKMIQSTMLKTCTQKAKSTTPFKYPCFHTKMFANTWIITILLLDDQCFTKLQWDPHNISYARTYALGCNNKDHNLIELLNKSQMKQKKLYYLSYKNKVMYNKGSWIFKSLDICNKPTFQTFLSNCNYFMSN